MNWKTTSVVAIAAASMLFGSVSASLAEQAPATSMQPMTISRVIAYGQENQDPLALVTAVRMLNDLGAHVAQPGAQSEPTGEQSQPMYDPVALLEEAQGYATGNDQLIAMIDAEMDNIESSRWVCYWEVYCDAWGWCNYVEVCY
ncbi:MAG: hypothetical protein ACFCVH_11575 [Alphaproteobacteria bacterium]